MELREGEKLRSPRRTRLGRNQNHQRHLIKKYNDIIEEIDKLVSSSKTYKENSQWKLIII